MVRLWDARTGSLLERFEGHGESVYSVAFTKDGKRLVSGALDKTVKIWAISPKTLHHMQTAHPTAETTVTTACLQTFTGHKDYVLCVATGFAFPGEDGSKEWVVSSSKDRTAIFWSADGKAKDAPLSSVAQFQVQGHKNSGTLYSHLTNALVIAVTLSPTGGKFATASGDTKARIWSYCHHKGTTPAHAPAAVHDVPIPVHAPIPAMPAHAHTQIHAHQAPAGKVKSEESK